MSKYYAHTEGTTTTSALTTAIPSTIWYPLCYDGEPARFILPSPAPATPAERRRRMYSRRYARRNGALR